MTIKQIQCLLTYLGYSPGTVDGINGPNTTAAVLRFQTQEALEKDGRPGPATQAALLAAVAAGRMYNPTADEKPSSGQPPDWWAQIKYFKRTDPGIRCPCPRCGGFPAEPTERLMRLADRVREQAGVPMNPSSTVRCQAHNDELPGSARNSRHLSGRAMDFCLKGWRSAKTLALVRKQPGVHYTYAINESYVHMDVD